MSPFELSAALQAVGAHVRVNLHRLPSACLTSEFQVSSLSAGMQCDRRLVELLYERFASGAVHMPFHSFVSCVSRLRTLSGNQQTSVRLKAPTRVFCSKPMRGIENRATLWTQEPLQRLCSHVLISALQLCLKQRPAGRWKTEGSTLWVAAYALSVSSLLKVFWLFPSFPLSIQWLHQFLTVWRCCLKGSSAVLSAAGCINSLCPFVPLL